MSTPFQNRIVGTIIVAAVVIIFLPDVLDGEKKSHQTDFEAIPDAPVFSGKLTNKPFPEDKLNKKAIEPISTEQGQDELLNNAQESDKLKVTPANKKQRGNSDEFSSDSSQTPQLSIAKKSPLIKPLPEKAIAKQAWVIHLGSFKHKQNVAQLLAKLKSNGYTAFTQPIKTKQGTLTKVFVGPELIKSSLDKKLPALKKLTNTTGKVARFYPHK